LLPDSVNQQIIFAAGFGQSDIENKIPATADTPYNIASLSKPFASAVLMRLVEENQLDLDTAIADILENTVFTYDDFKMHGYAEVPVEKLSLQNRENNGTASPDPHGPGDSRKQISL
jgi:CubicO group peptidase (beta-lactamase class C family)